MKKEVEELNSESERSMADAREHLQKALIT